MPRITYKKSISMGEAISSLCFFFVGVIWLSHGVDFFETGQFKSIDEFQITLDTDDFIASVHTVTMNDGHVEKVYAFAKLRNGKAYEWHILPMPTEM